MPLTIARSGETNYIKKITGQDDVRQRLAELGFVVGECVTVVSEIGGNMILSIKGTRVALDKSMTNRIMV
ncbi:MAG: FeoA family protein [Clostridia bacterium]|nr:FeoA family protein [Clostridia bacterium]